MRPILFRLGRLRIFSYTAALYVGIVLGIYAGAGAAPARGVAPATFVAVTLLLLTAALAGARLLFVATHWARFAQSPQDIFRTAAGGAAMYGGLIAAVPLSVPLVRAFDVPFWAYWDVASFTMLTGIVFGKCGCLLSGCCAGRASNAWIAVHLPDARGSWARRIPSQPLEAGWAGLVLVALTWLWSRGTFNGGLFLFTVAAYSTGRVVLESAREHPDIIGGVRLHQWLSLLFLLAALLVYAVTQMR
jgi:phosphatidylglycerol---prolipoprotein diacylglyceryl transferase